MFNEYEIFYDELIGMTHIAKHDVSLEEVDEVLSSDYLLETRKDGSNIAYKKISNGRFLQVVFRKISSKNFYIITAYDIEDKTILEGMKNYEDED